MQELKVTQTVNKKGLKIVVIGVGGGGSAMINKLVDSDLADKVKLAVIDTHEETLAQSKAPHKLMLDIKWPKGLDGMGVGFYRDTAIAQRDKIKDLIIK